MHRTKFYQQTTSLMLQFIFLKFCSTEGRTRDITAYVHTTMVGEYGPLPPEAQICGSHPGDVDDGAIINFQCKPPMYIILLLNLDICSDLMNTGKSSQLEKQAFSSLHKVT